LATWRTLSGRWVDFRVRNFEYLGEIEREIKNILYTYPGVLDLVISENFSNKKGLKKSRVSVSLSLRVQL